MTMEALPVSTYILAVWNLIIRPPRRRYSRLELCGQFGNRFRVGNVIVNRINYEITNEPGTQIPNCRYFIFNAMETSKDG
eukprot:s1661_g5.t1